MVYLTDKYVRPERYAGALERTSTITSARALELLAGGFVCIARDDAAAAVLAAAIGVPVERVEGEPEPGDIIVVGQISEGGVSRWVRAGFELTEAW